MFRHLYSNTSLDALSVPYWFCSFKWTSAYDENKYMFSTRWWWQML